MLLARTAGVVVNTPAGAVVDSGRLVSPPVITGLSPLQAVVLVVADGAFIWAAPVPLGLEVGWDNFNDANVRGFAERQIVTLGTRLFLDGGGIIAVSRRYSSNYIVFDPSLFMSATGRIEFSAPVLGLGTSRGARKRRDCPGAPGVAYQNPTSRGINKVTDWATISGRTVDFQFVTQSPGDSIRVFTAASAVPESLTWALLRVGFGLVGPCLRRKHSRVAQLAG